MTSTFDEFAAIISQYEIYDEQTRKLVAFLCRQGAIEVEKKFGEKWNFEKREEDAKKIFGEIHAYQNFFSSVHSQLDHTTKYHLKVFSTRFEYLFEYVSLHCQLALTKKGIIGFWMWHNADPEFLEQRIKGYRHKKMVENTYPQLKELTV